MNYRKLSWLFLILAIITGSFIPYQIKVNHEVSRLEYLVFERIRKGEFLQPDPVFEEKLKKYEPKRRRSLAVFGIPMFIFFSLQWYCLIKSKE